MSHNTYGHIFRVTTWGESHGAAIGCVIDGCPPGILISRDEIQSFLNKRRPGLSRFVTQRQEPDEVEILSGVFHDTEGRPVSTGAPISLLIRNVDQRTKDYSDIQDKFRPGHADYTYQAKYGIRDYRGGGRSSARETAARVAAGAVARKVLGADIYIRGSLIQIGTLKVDRSRWSWDEVEQNPFFCADKDTVPKWEEYLNGIRKAGSSIGAVVEIVADGVPAGWGAPIYGKLDQDIAAAMMSINAVKGVEIGIGMRSAELTGEENADEMLAYPETEEQNKYPIFSSNNSGGILGGISTGQQIVCRFAVKPTSSILTPRKTITTSGKPTMISTKGRHDPCVGIRAVPVGEAMLACVLTDHMLRHRGQCGSK
ncbi:MAG: chorismate synthase [Hyphomicrobium sp.]